MPCHVKPIVNIQTKIINIIVYFQNKVDTLSQRAVAIYSCKQLIKTATINTLYKLRSSFSQTNPSLTTFTHTTICQEAEATMLFSAHGHALAPTKKIKDPIQIGTTYVKRYVNGQSMQGNTRLLQIARGLYNGLWAIHIYMYMQSIK